MSGAGTGPFTMNTVAPATGIRSLVNTRPLTLPVMALPLSAIWIDLAMPPAPIPWALVAALQ